MKYKQQMEESQQTNPPSKMSFTAWGETASIELEGSDLDMEKFYELCERLAGAAGFAPKTIEEYFGNR